MTITETELEEIVEFKKNGHFQDDMTVDEYIVKLDRNFDALVDEVRRLREVLLEKDAELKIAWALQEQAENEVQGLTG